MVAPIDPKTITVLPGYALVAIDAMYTEESVGGIIIPQSQQKTPSLSGRVITISPTHKQHRDWYREDLTGKRVVLQHGRTNHLQDNVFKVMIDNIVAATDDDAVLKPHLQDIPRCNFCGPAKSHVSQNNTLLTEGTGGVMYCPRCNRDSAGNRYEPDAVRVSDDEVEAYSPTAKRQSGRLQASFVSGRPI